MTPLAEDHALNPPFRSRPRRPPADTRRRAPVGDRLAQRRRRLHRIRTWVVGTGVAVFLAVWAVMFWNIVSHHAATVAATTTAQVASATGSGSTSGSSSGTTGSSGSGSSGSSSSTGSSSSSGTTSHVTSSQS